MRIKELREERDLTQEDVAKAIQTSQRNISRWEKGQNEPASSFLIKLADFFDVSIDFLVSRSDDFGNIVAASNSSASLTAEDQEILKLFQSLSPSRKEDLKIYLRALSGSSASTTKKKA